MNSYYRALCGVYGVGSNSTDMELTSEKPVDGDLRIQEDNTSLGDWCGEQKFKCYMAG